MRVAIDIHQSDEKEADIPYAILLQSLKCGAYDALLDTLHEDIVGKGYGADRAHTASIGSCVAIPDSLVVLSYGQNAVIGAVGRYKDGALDALEILLDDDALSTASEHTVEELAKPLLSLLAVLADEYALAGS